MRRNTRSTHLVAVIAVSVFLTVPMAAGAAPAGPAATIAGSVAAVNGGNVTIRDTVLDNHYRRTASELHSVRCAVEWFKTDGNVGLHGRAASRHVHCFAVVGYP